MTFGSDQLEASGLQVAGKLGRSAVVRAFKVIGVTSPIAVFGFFVGGFIYISGQCPMMFSCDTPNRPLVITGEVVAALSTTVVPIALTCVMKDKRWLSLLVISAAIVATTWHDSAQPASSGADVSTTIEPTTTILSPSSISDVFVVPRLNNTITENVSWIVGNKTLYAKEGLLIGSEVATPAGADFNITFQGKSFCWAVSGVGKGFAMPFYEPAPGPC